MKKLTNIIVVLAIITTAGVGFKVYNYYYSTDDAIIEYAVGEVVVYGSDMEPYFLMYPGKPCQVIGLTTMADGAEYKRIAYVTDNGSLLMGFVKFTDLM